ncbi:GDSL esterase/lipase [Senna tora]|uniref:GDSL esterase/lipase n=1 Tax=Senna tora TaxID=362788 RepID=A0A834TZ79_9FABA|nr:GDSL esterase/lipase [Senna tora]
MEITMGFMIVIIVLMMMKMGSASGIITFVFGDSLTDVGNNNYLQYSLARSNYPWYGIDYSGGQPTGRFTNGRTIGDIISEKLGIPSPPPYLSLSQNDDALLKGVNYASGGAGILNDTGLYFIQRLSFDDQINNFYKTKQTIKAKIGDEAANKLCNDAMFFIGIAPLPLPPPPSEKPLPRKGKLFAAFTRPRLLFLDEPTSGLDSAASYYVMRAIARLGHKDGIQRTIIASIHQPSSDVFQLFHNLCLHRKKLAFSRQWLLRRWAGSNDYVNNFLQPFLADGQQYTHDEFVDLLISTLDQQLTRLYEVGARKMVFHGVGPLGCIPSQRVKSKKGQCLKRVNEWIMDFNSRVQKLIHTLNHRLPNAKLIFADTYPLVLDLINNPSTYGFKVSNTSCCNVDTSIGGLCLPNSKLCSNRKEYVFWDAFHPSDAANAQEYVCWLVV